MVGTGGQGVVQDVAEDLLEAERVGLTQTASGQRQLSASTGVAPLAERSQVVPRLAHDLAERARLAVEHDRRRVAADVLVEAMQVVLGLLDAADQVERLGPVADGRASISRQAWLRCSALRLSWASPATISPMAASRSACKARPCASLRSVTSSMVPT